MQKLIIIIMMIILIILITIIISLSPLLFVLCMVPLTWPLRSCYGWGNKGFKLNHLLFMDDVKLFAKK